MVSELINANPVIYEKKERRVRSVPSTADEYAVEPIDQEEIFDILFVCVCVCVTVLVYEAYMYLLVIYERTLCTFWLLITVPFELGLKAFYYLLYAMKNLVFLNYS